MVSICRETVDDETMRDSCVICALWKGEKRLIGAVKLEKTRIEGKNAKQSMNN